MKVNTILATKKDMGQAFYQGRRTPVTRLVAGPCVVTQVKTIDRDGYWAIQIGFGSRKLKNTPKPIQGHLKAALKDEKRAVRYLKEVKFDDRPEVKVGDEIKLTDVLAVGDTVTVTGVSKGKGFAGGMKRWGFKGGPRTHGQSDRARAVGSIGQGTTPGRVHKGKKMPGRMGTNQVTVKGLKVLDINQEKNEVSISGPVPGPTRGLIVIKVVKKVDLVKKEKEQNEKS